MTWLDARFPTTRNYRSKQVSASYMGNQVVALGCIRSAVCTTKIFRRQSQEALHLNDCHCPRWTHVPIVTSPEEVRPAWPSRLIAKTAWPADALPYFEFREGGVSVPDAGAQCANIGESPLVCKPSTIKFNSTMENMIIHRCCLK